MAPSARPATMKMWQADELRKLVELRKAGHPWKYIVFQLPGRTTHSCQQKWYEICRAAKVVSDAKNAEKIGVGKAGLDLLVRAIAEVKNDGEKVDTNGLELLNRAIAETEEDSKDVDTAGFEVLIKAIEEAEKKK